MRSKDEINLEVQTLENMKPNVRQFSKFSMYGDDHHAAIDAQIYVLSNHVSEDDMYETYGESNEDLDDSDFEQHVLDAAIEAYDWKMCRSDALPSESWKDLVKPA
jgi:hypothetical protein